MINTNLIMTYEYIPLKKMQQNNGGELDRLNALKNNRS